MAVVYSLQRAGGNPVFALRDVTGPGTSTADLAATDGADSFSGDCILVQAGNLAATDGADALAAKCVNTPFGTTSVNIEVSDGADSFYGFGGINIGPAAELFADLAATEDEADTAHFVARFEPYTVTVMAPTGWRRYPLRKQTATMPGAQ
jgi:hypothetical protein